MSWQPLVTGERSAAIAAIVRDVVAAIDATEPRGAYDLADRALMHAYAAEEEVAPDALDRGGHALAGAVTELASSQMGPALFGGAAGVGWRVAHVAAEEDAALVCGKIDAGLVRLAADEPDYDLISGLVGFGVYALARGEAGRPIASAVMDRFAAMARPRRGGLAIHTPPERLPAWQRREAPDGYWNFGVAHGMSGVAALLARFVAAGVEAERAGALLEKMMRCLLTIAPTATGEKYPAWLPGRPGDELGDIPDGERGGRLAWCYGDFGVSLGLLSAAQATGNAVWRDEALALARACAARSDAKAQLRDCAVCHGALGVAHQFNRLWQTTGDAAFEAAARHWLDRGLAMRRDHPIGGFPACLFEDGVETWIADGTLLSGAAGVALILHAMITTTEPLWDRLLLIDLEPAALGP